MGGGYMFTGNPRSFAAPRPPNTVGATRGFHTHSPPTAVCGGCSLQRSHNTCNCVFGPAPSRAEVERAILELQRLMQLSAQSEIDGLQGLLMHHNSLPKMIHSPGFIKFNDAFTMMRNEPSLQNMVVSISCDKAVWESILSNKAVEDLQGSTTSTPSVDKEETKLVLRCGGKEHDVLILIMKWVAGFTKSSLYEKLASLVSDIFKSTPKAKEKPTSELTDLLEEKLRSSLLLSVVILLIVVVTRNGQS